MSKPYSEIRQTARYELTGHGARVVGSLMESLEHIEPSRRTDIYGTGSIINDFEKELAELLGKESAVFFPSGTMAQQIAMRLWSDAAGLKKVAYHPLCHLEIHEQDGLKVLHQLEPVLLGNRDRLLTKEDLKALKEPVACVLIELPQREIGGQLPSWEELLEIVAFCKYKGIKLHLDGARLFEVLPYYNKSAADICALFDSVYVSFYKGIGGIAGAILAGEADFVQQSKVWKRRHGGDLISLYPYILSAKHFMNKRMGKMKEYWTYAQDIAARLNSIDGIQTIPAVPVCNMFHVSFQKSKEEVEEIFGHIIEQYGIAIVTSLRETSTSSCHTEMSFGDSFESIPEDVLDAAFALLEKEFKASTEILRSPDL